MVKSCIWVVTMALNSAILRLLFWKACYPLPGVPICYYQVTLRWIMAAPESPPIFFSYFEVAFLWELTKIVPGLGFPTRDPSTHKSERDRMRWATSIEAESPVVTV